MRLISVLAITAAMAAGATGLAHGQDGTPDEASPTTRPSVVPGNTDEGTDTRNSAEGRTTAAPYADGAIPAMTEERLTEQLNASEICAPLSIDINDVTSLFGLAIPSFLPIDPNVRWNRNAHQVENLVSNEGTFEATINVGCQPGSNGTVLEYLGLTPERLRLPGTAFCAGAIDEAGRPVGADCTLEGRIVPYVGKTIDLEGRLERALTQPVASQADRETR